MTPLHIYNGGGFLTCYKSFLYLNLKLKGLAKILFIMN